MAMSERERMEKFIIKMYETRNLMRNARVYMTPTRGSKSRTEFAASLTQRAREANRQAVRIWWRLDEKEER